MGLTASWPQQRTSRGHADRPAATLQVAVIGGVYLRPLPMDAGADAHGASVDEPEPEPEPEPEACAA